MEHRKAKFQRKKKCQMHQRNPNPVFLLKKKKGKFRHRNMETAHKEEGHMPMAGIKVMPLQIK